MLSVKLRRSGVHPKVVSDILEHKKVNLAMDVYDGSYVEDFEQPFSLVVNETSFALVVPRQDRRDEPTRYSCLSCAKLLQRICAIKRSGRYVVAVDDWICQGWAVSSVG